MTENLLKPYVIGLDLGGTNSVFGIVDARGEIKATTAIKTGGYDRVEDYVRDAVNALMPIIETVGGLDTIKAMGIGAPNANYYRDTIECMLADEFGKWYGHGISLYQSSFPIHSQYKFPHAGQYTFSFRQGMRDDALKGIQEIGFSVRPAK